MILGILNVPAVDLVWRAFFLLALGGAFTSTIYLAMTLVATVRHLRRARSARTAPNVTPPPSLPPVTIFKPVHGMEEQLAAHLEGFFRQGYPSYQIVFRA